MVRLFELYCIRNERMFWNYVRSIVYGRAPVHYAVHYGGLAQTTTVVSHLVVCAGFPQCVTMVDNQATNERVSVPSLTSECRVLKFHLGSSRTEFFMTGSGTCSIAPKRSNGFFWFLQRNWSIPFHRILCSTYYSTHGTMRSFVSCTRLGQYFVSCWTCSKCTVQDPSTTAFFWLCTKLFHTIRSDSIQYSMHILCTAMRSFLFCS